MEENWGELEDLIEEHVGGAGGRENLLFFKLKKLNSSLKFKKKLI